MVDKAVADIEGTTMPTGDKEAPLAVTVTRMVPGPTITMDFWHVTTMGILILMDKMSCLTIVTNHITTIIPLVTVFLMCNALEGQRWPTQSLLTAPQRRTSLGTTTCYTIYTIPGILSMSTPSMVWQK